MFSDKSMVSKQRLAENHVLGYPLILTSHHCWKMVPHMKTTLATSDEPLLGSAQHARLSMEYMFRLVAVFEEEPQAG